VLAIADVGAVVSPPYAYDRHQIGSSAAVSTKERIRNKPERAGIRRTIFGGRTGGPRDIPKRERKTGDIEGESWRKGRQKLS
jgi:hypothetical protein